MATSSNDGVQHQRHRASQTEVSDFTDESSALDTNTPQAHSDTHSQRAKLLMWLIVVAPQEQRGMVLPINDGALIGRHGDIVWHDERMSREHAKFELVDDPDEPTNQRFAITPVKDRNGTRVNGYKIKKTTPLYENDVIIMGNTRFVVKVLE